MNWKTVLFIALGVLTGGFAYWWFFMRAKPYKASGEGASPETEVFNSTITVGEKKVEGITLPNAELTVERER